MGGRLPPLCPRTQNCNVGGGYQPPPFLLNISLRSDTRKGDEDMGIFDPFK